MDSVELLKNINIAEACRACFETSKYSRLLYEAAEGIENRTLGDVFFNVVKIEEVVPPRVGTLPTRICLTCSYDLINAYNFIQKSQKNNEHLIELLKHSHVQNISDTVQIKIENENHNDSVLMEYNNSSINSYGSEGRSDHDSEPDIKPKIPKLQCIYCNQILKDQHLFEIHMETHTEDVIKNEESENGKNRLECYECDFSCQSNLEMDKHQHSVNTTSSEVISFPPLSWNPNEIQETQKIFRSWGVNSVASGILKTFGLNSIEVLDKMEMEDVDRLFSKLDSSGYFGERIKFQSGLKKWRKERNKPLDTGTLSIPSTCRVLELLEKISDNLNPSCSSSSHPSNQSKPNETSIKDLTGLLRSSIKGQFLLAFYEKNGHLDNRRQKDLTHCIVERFVGTGMKMSYRDMNDWATAIAETFPSENKDTYFLPRKVGKKNPTGKLFSRWCNEYSTFNEKVENERAADNENKRQELMSNDFSEEKYWLQNNCSPWETVIEFWQQTSKLRTGQFQSDEQSSLTTLLEQWPRLNDANGFELINLDFDTLHPGKGNLLFTKFENFYSKIKLHFDQDVKDKTSKEMLQYLHKDDVSKDSKDCIATLLLHSLLQPVRQKKGYKPTIADAQSDFVVHIRNITDLISTVENVKKTFLERNEKCQPRIIAVGPEIYDLKEFYVFCDGTVKYKFCSYSKCLDTILKLCSVYKIEYSQKSKLVWTFLERYFFEIESEIYSSVSNLINKLSKK